jgi:AraC-like DNA-binding protein
VAHQPGDPLADATERSGDPGVPVSSPASSAVARRIASLGRYTVERFRETAADEVVLRGLGALFAAEAAAADEAAADEAAVADAAAMDAAPAVATAAVVDGTHAAAGGGRAASDPALVPARAGSASTVGATSTAGAGRGPVPIALEAMTAFVTANLDRPLSVAEIAAAGDCSVSTAGRLFATHLGTSVSAWVRGARMREATELLRTTGLRVGEVARTVGFEDPLYFSRVFRSEYGVPPSRYGRDRIRP